MELIKNEKQAAASGQFKTESAKSNKKKIVLLIIFGGYVMWYATKNKARRLVHSTLHWKKKKENTKWWQQEKQTVSATSRTALIKKNPNTHTHISEIFNSFEDTRLSWQQEQEKKHIPSIRKQTNLLDTCKLQMRKCSWEKHGWISVIYLSQEAMRTYWSPV